MDRLSEAGQSDSGTAARREQAWLDLAPDSEDALTQLQAHPSATVRCHGLFSPYAHHRRLVVPAPGPARVSGGDEPEPVRTRARMSWSQRLHRVLAIEVRTCARCSAALRELAVITEPRVITAILAQWQRVAGNGARTHRWRPRRLLAGPLHARDQRRGLVEHACFAYHEIPLDNPPRPMRKHGRRAAGPVHASILNEADCHDSRFSCPAHPAIPASSRVARRTARLLAVRTARAGPATRGTAHRLRRDGA
jgi:hypothetical protein